MANTNFLQQLCFILYYISIKNSVMNPGAIKSKQNFCNLIAFRVISHIISPLHSKEKKDKKQKEKW